MLLVVSSVAALFIVAARVAAQTAPGSGEDGVEVLTRGPVHEGYAEAVDANPQAAPIVDKKPPDPIPELPPDQKPEGDKVEWIAGYWAWDGDRKDYIWVSGFWRTPPPGRVWVPGRWQEAQDGWQWVPGFWNAAEKQDVAYVPAPPAPVEERVAPSPGEGYFYTPGVWVYRDGKYLWRAGVWVPYSEDYVWVPAHYVWTPAGYVFIEGYWDHVPRHRGILFAPVYVSPTLVVRTEFCYVPRHVVAEDFMIGCLFVRPAYHHYYYGDYFEARYTDAGFVAFVDYHYGHWHDPLYGFYVHYPPRRDWERETRAVYVGRFHGDIARPPHSYAEAERLHVSVTFSIGEAEHHGFRTEHITHEQVVHAHEAAVVRHEAAVQRAKVEMEIHSHGPIKVGEAPHVAKFDPKAQPSHTENHNVSNNTGGTTHTGGGTPSGGGSTQTGTGGTTHTGGPTSTTGGTTGTTHTGGLTTGSGTSSTGGTTTGTTHTGGPTTGSGTSPTTGGTTTGTTHTGGPTTGSGTTGPGTGSSSTGTGGSHQTGGSSNKGSGSGHPPPKDSKDKKDHQ
jgi:hypothetical protein